MNNPRQISRIFGWIDGEEKEWMDGWLTHFDVKFKPGVPCSLYASAIPGKQ